MNLLVQSALGIMNSPSHCDGKRHGKDGTGRKTVSTLTVLLRDPEPCTLVQATLFLCSNELTYYITKIQTNMRSLQAPN